MAKCKKCKKEITHLDYSAELKGENAKGIFQAPKECHGYTTSFFGDDDDEHPAKVEDADEIKFYCPECKELITENEKEADDFLMDGRPNPFKKYEE